MRLVTLPASSCNGVLWIIYSEIPKIEACVPSVGFDPVNQLGSDEFNSFTSLYIISKTSPRGKTVHVDRYQRW